MAEMYLQARCKWEAEGEGGEQPGGGKWEVVKRWKELKYIDLDSSKILQWKDLA